MQKDEKKERTSDQVVEKSWSATLCDSVRSDLSEPADIEPNERTIRFFFEYKRKEMRSRKRELERTKS